MPTIERSNGKLILSHHKTRVSLFRMLHDGSKRFSHSYHISPSTRERGCSPSLLPREIREKTIPPFSREAFFLLSSLVDGGISLSDDFSLLRSQDIINWKEGH
ncbi:hypothetical protein TNCV_3507621 [Trichonephila clavipes]|uniref:Uncharacterized protein n=1 Tax=Trichonephila clavipes TaxID=2585209 RepID=A0A8X6RW18_TRICX|nr:hypothetical protein TNCV_3507621 [Trichonephila clavipes]